MSFVHRIVAFCFFISLGLYAKVIPINEIFEPNENLYPPERFGKVAVVQWAPDDDAPLGSTSAAQQFKQKNIVVLERYIRQAAANGAKLVATPEFGFVGYPDIPGWPPELDNFRSRQDLEPYVETIPGPSTNFFSKLAQELKIYIHIGLAEVDPLTDFYHNTVVAIGPSGEILATYRKIQLFHNEGDYLIPGDRISTYQSIFGKIGIIICADVWADFPMEYYLEANINVLILSTSWANYNTGWDYFTDGARWVDAYFLAANQNYFPDSGVINPDGSTQSHIRQSTGIAYGYLPLR